MRLLEFFLASIMRDAQRLRDNLQATLIHRGFRQAHTEALQLRHELLVMLATEQQPPEAERS